MQTRFSWMLLGVALTLGSVTSSGAAELSETLFPATTKGFLAVPDVDLLREKWNETQLGQLTQDPVMQPFIEDLKRQLRNKLSQTGVKLGITWSDLDGVYAGEVAVAVIQPDLDPEQHALALIVDVTDKQQNAEALIEKISANLKENYGATRATEQLAEVEVVVFTIPDEAVESGERFAFYRIHENTLVSTDHRQTMVDVLKKLRGGEGDSLATHDAFMAAMDRAQLDGVTPHVRWFVEPFGYGEVMRAATPGPMSRKTDLLKVLSHQGFRDAIQGLGGHVTFRTEKHEILHRTFVFAPGSQHAEGSERYTLAARMLDFPNEAGLVPQPFVPKSVASFLTFNWKMAQAFEHSKSLINELIGSKPDQDLFEEIIGSLATDPDGPRVDIRKDLVQHLGTRATLISESRLPITPKSERILIAVALDNPEEVARTVHRAMDADPDAQRREFAGQEIWEIIPEEPPVDVPELEVFDPFGGAPEAADDQAEKRAVPKNSAVTVAFGHMIMANNIDYIYELLKERDSADHLREMADYKSVETALEMLGADADAFRFFTRTDAAYRPTYELIREGKMPEAESLLGKLLNRLLGSEEEGFAREQQIDGSKLPEYQLVRRYLGPAGLFVRSEEDGWFAAGCLLSTEVALEQADASTTEIVGEQDTATRR